ncbi:MAG: pyruvate kinase [Lachnospiraceae bacterium]|nr:pyruvate kinase [Lachnospiraceae bacterium]
MRKTKIVCTIGPACETKEKMKELMSAGMDMARFNFSHGTQQDQKERLERVREAAGELGLPIATLLDTKGPEIRLRDIEGGKAELKAGQIFTLTTEEMLGNSERAAITYQGLPGDVEKGMAILIDDGRIDMRVEEIGEKEIRCKVVTGGMISNHKGVNVPGAILSMPYINEVDKSDILFGIENGYDYLAASFVRCKEDVLELRRILRDHESQMKIISKIENMQGVQNLDEIISVSDGIMVARGDMGVEIPMEEVPVLQKEMIKKTTSEGKLVITATQMLESMIHNPRPTRAEVTDVANAIYDGTTAVMLSGESAAGEYPREAVETMARIAERAEQDVDYAGRMNRILKEADIDITKAISHACCTTAIDLHAKAIITVTMSGFTAGMISRHKPECMIIGCTMSPRVWRQMNLFWGVTPLRIDEQETTNALFDHAVEAAKKSGLVEKGDTVVLTAGVPLGVSGNTNMIRVVEVV